MLIFKWLSLEDAQKMVMEYLKAENIEGINWVSFERIFLCGSKYTYPKYRNARRFKKHLERKVSDLKENKNNDTKLLFRVLELFLEERPIITWLENMSPILNSLPIPLLALTLIIVAFR